MNTYMSYNGFPSRLAWLEAQRQSCLEAAEVEEHLWGHASHRSNELRGQAKILQMQIEAERLKERQ